MKEVDHQITVYFIGSLIVFTTIMGWTFHLVGLINLNIGFFTFFTLANAIAVTWAFTRSLRGLL